MRYLYTLLIIIITFPVKVNAQHSLRASLDVADFFSLRDSFKVHEYHLEQDIRLYFSAFIDNAFNRNELSSRKVDSFLRLRKDDWYDSEIAELLQMQRDNYLKTYHYKEAAMTGRYLLSSYKQAIDPSIAVDLANSNKIWEALSGVPPQSIDAHGDVNLTSTKDKANLWTVKVQAADLNDDFIFDTGANISTVTESSAKRMQLRRLPTSFNVHGFQGTSITTTLGIADSIQLGTMIVRNVVFMIMPDEALTFPQIDYAIKGIIGFPVINAMKEVRIYKKGNIVIPETPQPLPAGQTANLALHGLYPLIQLGIDHDLLTFHFDTGAKVSDLFDTYFNRYKKYVLRKGKHKVVEFGSAGGSRKMDAFELKDFRIYIGDKRATIPRISVLTHPIKTSSELVYGNIGQDLMEQFDEMVINFESMYVRFE